MTPSFLFYDVETSGLNPRQARVMQFAGLRTDMEFKPIGEPLNLLIKLTPDVLPEAAAVLITGITPQQSQADGITEAEFLKLFHSRVVLPSTIFVGYNNVRFDDEFLRYLHYRNFYDAYEWQWQNKSSRWDLLDVVRMMRALRPEGLNWPVAEDGKSTNRLELITAANNLGHEKAHDALSDVKVLIDLAKLIQAKQPKLFDFLLSMRQKQAVAELVSSGLPFIYTSGSLPSEYEKTTVVKSLSYNANRQTALIYDLRFDPADFAGMSLEQLTDRLRYNSDRTAPQSPMKLLNFKRNPAVAPVNVLDEPSQSRIKLDKKTWQTHANKLLEAKDLAERLIKAANLANQNYPQKHNADLKDVDSQLYDDFFDDHDRLAQRQVLATDPHQLGTFDFDFHDQRLGYLLRLYKARNYPNDLSAEERRWWDDYCREKLLDGGSSSRLERYFEDLQAYAKQPQFKDKTYLLDELRLYGETLIPSDI